MAQDCILGNTPVECSFEHINIVDSFSTVGSFFEEILIHVGDDKRVRIHATRSGEDPLKQRTCTTSWQCWSYSWLKHSIPFGHTTGSLIDLWTIQRVGHFPHESPGSSARKSSISIECDHVTNARRHGRGNKRQRRIGGQETRVGRSPQQSIQLVEFATFAFPPHPFSLSRVPQPSTMEKKESFADRRRCMTRVQMRNASNRNAEKFVVFCGALCCRVFPIREKREMKFVILICQIVNLKPLNLFFDLFTRRQEGGHNNNCTQTRRYTIMEFQTGQCLRTKPIRDPMIHNRNSYFR